MSIALCKLGRTDKHLQYCPPITGVWSNSRWVSGCRSMVCPLCCRPSTRDPCFVLQTLSMKRGHLIHERNIYIYLQICSAYSDGCCNDPLQTLCKIFGISSPWLPVPHRRVQLWCQQPGRKAGAHEGRRAKRKCSVLPCA